MSWFPFQRCSFYCEPAEFEPTTSALRADTIDHRTLDAKLEEVECRTQNEG